MGVFSTTCIGDTKVYGGDTITNIDKTMSPKAIEQSNKIRKAIIKDMVAECTIQDNILNGTIVAICHSPAFDSHLEIYIRFKINGRDFEIKENMSSIEWRKATLGKDAREFLKDKLYEVIIKHISASIIVQEKIEDKIVNPSLL